MNAAIFIIKFTEVSKSFISYDKDGKPYFRMIIELQFYKITFFLISKNKNLEVSKINVCNSAIFVRFFANVYCDVLY